MKNRGRLFFEFILIVVGVLVALALESWFEDRSDDALRQAYLSRLGDDLRADIYALEQRVRFFSSVRGFGIDTLAWIASDEPADSKVLVSAFFAAEVFPFEASDSTFRDLQSTGNIRLLEDLELRMALSGYYAGARQRQNGWELPGAYREVIRGLVPPDLQTRIRQECPSTDPEAQLSRLGNCGISFARQSYEPALAALRADTNAPQVLTYRISEVEVAVFLYESQLRMARELVEAIESRIASG